MRLTSREYGETCLINEKGIIPCGSVCDEHDNCTTCPLQKAINKLAEYEDLEEQCIEENQCDLRMLLLKWKEFFDDIAELYDYRKAEEQGLLLRLPCKVGDTVFIPMKPYILEYNITSFEISRYGSWLIHLEHEEERRRFRTVELGESIGKTWFLTREEAESALAEKGGSV